jgi:hypothetical protein
MRTIRTLHRSCDWGERLVDYNPINYDRTERVDPQQNPIPAVVESTVGALNIRVLIGENAVTDHRFWKDPVETWTLRKTDPEVVELGRTTMHPPLTEEQWSLVRRVNNKLNACTICGKIEAYHVFGSVGK